MSKKSKSNYTRLPHLLESIDGAGVSARLSVDEIGAVFNAAPEASGERAKLERFIRLIMQQHLKGLAQAIKLICVAVAENVPQVGVDGIKGYLGLLVSGYDNLAGQRLAILNKNRVVVAKPSDVPEVPDVPQ